MKWVFGQDSVPLRLGLSVGVLCLMTASVGCGVSQSLPQLGLPLPVALTGPPTAIGTLSEQGQNGIVAVQGQVKQRAPLATGWLYRLEDESGSIWVRSQEVAPPLDSWIRLEGQLQYRQILVDGTDQGEHYLEEQNRRSVQAESEAVETEPEEAVETESEAGES